ncbi:MAG: MlaD family protein, partial [Flavisolibacter sp.]
MAKKILNTTRLGIFVLAGLAILILLLYVIGKNQNLFGNTFILKARFEDVHGLMPGNNIRFGGINAGTVKSVEVINDTTIEVSLLVKQKMKQFIHKNAIVSIGTDGLMGNKLITIQPVKISAPLVDEGDVLLSSTGMDTNAMFEVLNVTNNDISIIAKELKQTVQRLNSSKAMWSVLNDESLPASLRFSLLRIRNASAHMNEMMLDLSDIAEDMKNGKGSIGELLVDSSIAKDINVAVKKVKNITVSADSLMTRMDALVDSVNYEINNGEGTLHALLKDKEMVNRLNNSLKNIETGTEAFNANMEAIKHNFLF